MKNNNLEQFVKLRRELTQEKEQLSRRLAQINEALGEMSPPSLSAEQGTADGRMPQPEAPARRGRKPTGGGASLREHVIEVLRSGPKTKEEVLEAVQKRGYKFTTNNPLNSLGVILYGKNPKLKRVDGKFSLDGAAPASKAEASAEAPATKGKRRLSAAGRKAIADAARKRWAKARAAGK